MGVNKLARLSQHRTAFFIILAVLGFALLLIQSVRYAYTEALATLEQDSHFKLNLYKKVLLSELKRHAYLPLTLAKDKQIRRFLQTPNNPIKRQALNQYLQSLSEGTDALNIYLLDKNGTTIATSNWHDTFSFLGKNYRYRPYFQNALKGQADVFFAIGATTRTPGLFLSQPVYIKHQVQGVVAIKVSMQPLEALWAKQGNEKVFLTDAHGIIFSSNESNWIFHSLAPLTDAQKQRIGASRKYLNTLISPLNIKPVKPQTTNLVHINQPYVLEQTYLQQSQPLANRHWQLHILTDTQKAKQAAINAFFIGFLLLILCLLILYGLNKRRRIAKRLRQAHEQLEQRVTERTHELAQLSLELNRNNQQLKQANDALLQTQNELIQASKLSALGQLSASITHELNQPLAAIRTFANNSEKLLARNQPKLVAENLQHIFALTERMGNIINHFKTFARKTDASRHPVLITECIKQSLNLLAHLIQEKQIQVSLSGATQKLWVLGDAVRFEQVFVNILSNAIHALGKQTDKQIKIRCMQQNNRVIVQVKDNGAGIDESILDSIFDPFFSTKEVGEGMGLGLAIASRIIQEYGGHISAHNHEGAEIRIDLPKLKNPLVTSR